ncbi:MAG: dihydroorotate dehydrogenase electron transfer subunit [Nanoarchaeota archaeon]
MENKELMKSDMPTVLSVSKVIKEGKDQKTIFVKHRADVKPGQFYMIWIPGIDSKPYAVSYYNKNEIAFTSAAIGKFSNAFDKLKSGDKVGLFGPYGNGFSIKNDACVVAGGIGISSVSTLIDRLKNPIIIYGARKKEYLIYLKRYKNKKMLIATDDGSYGRKGFTTDVLKELLQDKKSRIKIVYTCGPEIMMKKVFDLCQKYNVECEASLERFMKCAFGICGACAINDRLVCIDGPVFNSQQLSKLEEFGKSARLKTGRKVLLKEYHAVHA